MMNVLITGSSGFIGKNLDCVLKHHDDVKIFRFDIGQTEEELHHFLLQADIIFHLAGVNRPQSEAEFSQVNTGFTAEICNFLSENKKSPRFVLSSSTQADLDNPYGASKKAAEEVLKSYQTKTGNDVVIYRLPGVFGKWSRPNYNTVAATFCHNIARDLPVQNNDPNRELRLVYIDDVVEAFISELAAEKPVSAFQYKGVEPVFITTLGELEAKIRSFRQSRNNLYLPAMNDRFTACLYATYTSFIPPGEYAYRLPMKEDPRGALAEFIKSPAIGQIFVSRTKPGITRGDHFHHTKVEKFFILEGQGIIRIKDVNTGEINSYPIDGRDFTVVDIAPGFTHSIENVGTADMVVLFWAGEIFNPQKTDTTFLPVL